MIHNKQLENGLYEVEIENKIYNVPSDHPIFVFRGGVLTGTTVGNLVQDDEYYHMAKVTG